VTAWLSERSRNGGVDQIPLPAGRGRLWLCGKHFVGPDPDGALERVGADSVVCLCERDELEERYPAYVRWLGEQAPGRALWYPIPDLHAPTPAAAGALLEELRARLDAGRSLLVHCGAGVGRAGTVAAGLLMGMGWPMGQAVAHVRSHRPMAGPEAGAQTKLLHAIASGRGDEGYR
jgi:protein-tyrosine phosphatase